MDPEKMGGYGSGRSIFNISTGIIKTFLVALVGIASLFIIVFRVGIQGNIWNTSILHLSIKSGSIKIIEPTKEYNELVKKLGLTPKNIIEIPTEFGSRKIHGRFIHITDFHPDPYYKVGSDIDNMCHSGEGSASKYGDAISGCDSPMILMQETINWMVENLKDKVDFIVWTGDNIRHDNDRDFPRTEQAILELNQYVSDKMYDAFSDPDEKNPMNMDVYLIPSLGNNDIFPHNLFAPGPTQETRAYYKIWKNYVPQDQFHTFNDGVYYFKEIIPNELAIISLNTLYLFDSNPLVDNCDDKKQPGYLLFRWLGHVLKELRARDMKVWITGHVPPNAKNYEETCLRKYIVWIHEYRDIIIGGLFGHMNIDHYIPLDSVAAYKSLKKDYAIKDSEFADDDVELLANTDYGESLGDVRIQGGVPYNKAKYMTKIREEYYDGLKGKKKSGAYSERYAIAHVNPSVIPTFNPSIRVWEYNTTNLENLVEASSNKFSSWGEYFEGLDKLLQDLKEQDDNEILDDMSYSDDSEISIEKKKKHKKKKKKKKKDKTIPPKMPKKQPLGPAYVPQTFTPERYVQYYADLESINNGDKDFEYEIEYSTDDAMYDLKALTVDEWITHGRKISSKNNMNDFELTEKMWKEYVRNAFVSTDYENKGYG